MNATTITRRHFIIGIAAAGATASLSIPVLAKTAEALEATAITQVFGDGLRFVAIAIRYATTIDGGDLNAEDFRIAGRTVTEVYPAHSTDPSDRADRGHFVIIALSSDDEAADLEVKADETAASGPGGPGGPGGGGGPGKAGEHSVSDATWASPQASVHQDAIVLSGGDNLPSQDVATTAVRNLILDDFQQLEWNDPETGDKLAYNLFVPRDYDPSNSYPLVNFMHDAGATSEDVLTTLKQGLGAICWAGPSDQEKRPCFVLAPQYDQIIADDESKTSSMLDTTINLIKSLTDKYSIDPKRLFTTGQSGGGMMSIAMNIKYPDFFAASFLVACQWEAALVAPMAKNRLFILVSQDDNKAFPGQNAITEALEKEGATIARAVWDGRWNADQFRFAFDDLEAEGAKINYVAFDEGSVFEEGADRQGASGHRNTWRIAYTIEPIREWLFR